MSADPNVVTTVQPVTSALATLVGDGKKFSSPEDLAKGKLESDAFITKLTTENRELRGMVGDLDKRLGVAEARVSILDRFEAPSSTGNQPGPANTQQPVTQTEKSLSEDDVEKLIERRENKSVQARNEREVDTVLLKQLGANAPAFLLQKAQDLGMEPGTLRQLAATSPRAFFNMIGIDPTQSPTGTVYNKGTSVGPSNKPAETRNYAWYETKKAELGVKKFAMNTKIQSEMHKDMQNLGDAFFA